METPIGPLGLAAEDGVLIAVTFDGASTPKPQVASLRSFASLTMFHPIYGMEYFANLVAPSAPSSGSRTRREPSRRTAPEPLGAWLSSFWMSSVRGPWRVMATALRIS